MLSKKTPEKKDITITVVSILGNLIVITNWQSPYLGIETETSVNMFPTFPKFRKPEESASRQFLCHRFEVINSSFGHNCERPNLITKSLGKKRIKNVKNRKTLR